MSLKGLTEKHVRLYHSLIFEPQVGTCIEKSK